MIPSRRSLLSWAVAWLMCVLVFGAALGLLVERDVVVCRNELLRVPEPPGWRAWPIDPTSGGYHVDSTPVNCVGHGLLCGMIATELRSDVLCPRGGISLDAWFDGSIYQSELDLTVREARGIFVAAGHPDINYQGKGPPTPDEERFLAAFRRHVGVARPVFKHGSVLLLASIVSATILGLLAAGVVACVAVRRATAFRRVDRSTLIAESEVESIPKSSGEVATRTLREATLVASAIGVALLVCVAIASVLATLATIS